MNLGGERDEEEEREDRGRGGRGRAYGGLDSDGDGQKGVAVAAKGSGSGQGWQGADEGQKGQRVGDLIPTQKRCQHKGKPMCCTQVHANTCACVTMSLRRAQHHDERKWGKGEGNGKKKRGKKEDSGRLLKHNLG